jgi:hypothetical protein
MNTGSSAESSGETSSSPTTTSSGPSTSTSQPSAPTGIDALRKMTTEASGKIDNSTAPHASKEVAPGVVAPTAPAYTPNFKVKYFDAENKKQIEKEIDEWAKGAIKDKETEDKVLKTFAKAYGLDAAVMSRDKYKGEVGALQQEISETKRGLNMLSNFVQQGDLHSFFEAAKIPEEKVLKYALERIQYREWTPEQRAQYDNQRDVAAKAAFYEEQNQSLAQQMQTAGVHQRTSELQQVMSDPQVTQVAQAFDAQMGQGAFWNEVVRRGQWYAHQFQQDIPAHQAVNEVMRLAGMGMQQQPQTQVALPQENTVSSQPGTTMASNQAPQQKPIIPNIQGSGASPAKKSPRSIADLKKLSQQMSG